MKKIKLISSLLLLLLIVSCGGNKDPKEYPKAILGDWYGLYIGKEVIIHIHSTKTLQIEFPENNLVYTTNYYFNDEEILAFEKPYQECKIKTLTDKEMEFELPKTKEKIPIPFIMGIVFKKMD